MMRSRASVPIAENMSAYLATLSKDLFAEACVIFRYLQKYRNVSNSVSPVDLLATELIAMGPRWRIPMHDLSAPRGRGCGGNCGEDNGSLHTYQ